MALLVFMYHRVLPQAHPEAVECGLFQRELDLLQKKFRILKPSQVEEYLRGKDFPEGKEDFAALTFDESTVTSTSPSRASTAETSARYVTGSFT